MFNIAYNLKTYNYFDFDTFSKIKSTTDNIIKNAKSEEEKIKIIYQFIIDNTTYDYASWDEFKKSTNTSNLSILPYSGIGAFKNKLAVCSGYAELMYFMLSFAGINDVEDISGRVTNYTTLGENHAWIRIGDKYYDPTFDDGMADSLHRYYGLNKDVMLGDRVEGYLNYITVEQMFNNYINLSSKYDYPILKGYKTLSELGIKNLNDLNTENLKQKLGEVNSPESGSKIYLLENPTSGTYVQLVLQLGENFSKGKIYIDKNSKVNFVVKS